MTLKFDMIMSCSDQTWSETHYYLQASDLPQTTGPFNALAALRQGVLGNYAFVVGYRISEVPANRVVQDEDWPPVSPITGYWPPSDLNGLYTATLPNVSILVRMTGQPNYSAPPKNLYLACPPRAATTVVPPNNVDLGNLPAFTTNLGRYMGMLTGSNMPQAGPPDIAQNAWGYRARQRGNSVNVLQINTNAGFPNTVGIVTQNALPGIGFGPTANPPGTSLEVYLTGQRRVNTRIPGLSGAWTVSAILPPVAPATSPYTYFLAGSGNVVPTNFPKPGVIAPLDYQYVPYSWFWTLDRAGTRKRGGSIGLRRGRSRIRA